MWALGKIQSNASVVGILGLHTVTLKAQQKVQCALGRTGCNVENFLGGSRALSKRSIEQNNYKICLKVYYSQIVFH
ncbi:hypothetical protein MRB53_014732 [Persea americana]|uniref:Uncharacterized protein n=1 Tax=Persea americana TaxID=3435 RepID=A0ACC2KC02_PERAE|nr:hypothetical protein MRB53_014732 [Persea americana]